MKDSLVFLDIQWGQQSSCGLGDVYVFRLGDENILLDGSSCTICGKQLVIVDRSDNRITIDNRPYEIPRNCPGEPCFPGTHSDPKTGDLYCFIHRIRDDITP